MNRIAIITMNRIAIITMNRIAIITMNRIAIITMNRIAIITMNRIAIITKNTHTHHGSCQGCLLVGACARQRMLGFKGGDPRPMGNFPEGLSR